MKKLLFVSTFASVVLTNSYSQEAALVTSVEGIKEYALPNGLKILLIPDAAQSNVIVNIIYGVGSRHEGKTN